MATGLDDKRHRVAFCTIAVVGSGLAARCRLRLEFSCSRPGRRPVACRHRRSHTSRSTVGHVRIRSGGRGRVVAPNKAIRRLYISEIARFVLQGERSITILLRLLSLARAAFRSCGSRNYARLAGQRECRQTCGRAEVTKHTIMCA